MTIKIITSINVNEELVSNIFKRHNIKVIISKQNLSLTDSTRQEELLTGSDLILYSDNFESKLTYALASGEVQVIQSEGTRSDEIVISTYISEVHKYNNKDLSCRTDSISLNGFINTDGTADLTKNPKDWIENNEFFKKINTPFYRNLLNFTLNERGMFLKVWKYKNQKNYWNSTFNGGLPIVKKKDQVHEGTFLLHDIWHFVFKDPVITGKETDLEIQAYVANRLMSEAFTMVLTDMFAVDHSKIHTNGYDTNKRKIFPVLMHSAYSGDNLSDVKKLLWANAKFALFGNMSDYERIVTNNEVLDEFHEKYSIFFSVDLQWNYKNIHNQINQINHFSNLSEFAKELPQEVGNFTTNSLYESIKIQDDKISFDKLFEIFWNQLISVLHYAEEFDHIKYAKLATQKHIAGQMFTCYKFNDVTTHNQLEKYAEYQAEIEQANNLHDINTVYTNFNNKFVEFLNELQKMNYILPDESTSYSLHSPHFPPIYSGYDNPFESYLSLKEVSEKIFQNKFVIEEINGSFKVDQDSYERFSREVKTPS